MKNFQNPQKNKVEEGQIRCEGKTRVYTVVRKKRSKAQNAKTQPPAAQKKQGEVEIVGEHTQTR